MKLDKSYNNRKYYLSVKYQIFRPAVLPSHWFKLPNMGHRMGVGLEFNTTNWFYLIIRAQPTCNCVLSRLRSFSLKKHPYHFLNPGLEILNMISILHFSSKILGWEILALYFSFSDILQGVYHLSVLLCKNKSFHSSNRRCNIGLKNVIRILTELAKESEIFNSVHTISCVLIFPI